MWVVNFVVMRDGERDSEGGSPRDFLDSSSAPLVPDIDHTVIHRGEAFVVDDVIWDLERKSVTVEIVPPEERDSEHSPDKKAIDDDDDYQGDEGDIDDDDYLDDDDEGDEGDIDDDDDDDIVPAASESATGSRLLDEKTPAPDANLDDDWEGESENSS